MNKQVKLEGRIKPIISVDGLEFQDLNENGRLDPYEDWRLPVEERVQDLVSQMTIDEKIGLMFIRSLPTGYSQKDKSLTSYDGVIDEETKTEENIFNYAFTPGTSEMILERHMRHFIMRESRSPEELATWMNAINEISESSRLGIPSIVASNSRNEKGEEVFGMNDAVGVFTTFTGTLGLGAVVQGYKQRGEDDLATLRAFAEVARQEWLATGLRKGYMYMIDVVTDPRWQRIYGTFGEDVELISRMGPALVEAFQGTELSSDSVALTMKHFPGGGARENGFDPHYEEGKYNVYVTEGSLEKYHLPPFESTMRSQPSSIMPYYSIPSKEKSVPQTYQGEVVEFEPYGFAFNEAFIKKILRDQMGFTGYINSDSGIINKMSWGVGELEVYERAAKAVNAGVDIISDSHETEALRLAYDEGLVDEERLSLAATRILTELFQLGLFDEARYVDPSKAAAAIKRDENLAIAKKQHQESLVLLKNHANALPLTEIEGKKIYVEAFAKKAESAAEITKAVRTLANEQFEMTLTDDAEEADTVIAFLRPQSGDYFNATPGLLELDLVEDMEREALDGSRYQETTVKDVTRLISILEAARKRGAKTIVSVNFTMPWILKRIEAFADVLIASFDTFEEAQFELITGEISPRGALPITLPASLEVIEVIDGISVSPNDVPGYAKQAYMPEGMEYAYRDEDDNVYALGHGLDF